MKRAALSPVFASLTGGTAQAASDAAGKGYSTFVWIFFGMVGLIITVLLVSAVKTLRGPAGNAENESEDPDWFTR